MKRLSPITRILLGLAVLAMLAGYRLPMWQIHLWAPQYPEGLNMKIWLDHLSGDFQIINGLNHYIGMKMIKEEMFPEFKYMGYALGFLIAMGLLPVVSGRRRLLQCYVVLLFIAGALGLYDFHRWGHDYGHNLDPRAAISVPGMTYDPPIIGYKALLNFTAYSGPDKGGMILIGSGAVSVLLLGWELWRARRESRQSAAGSGPAAKALAATALVSLTAGCESGPQPIEYGRDACAGCNMTIADQRFGAELVTGKGKVYKFDDVNCLVEFIGSGPHASDASGDFWIADFNGRGRLLHADQAVYLKHEQIRSPMRSGTAAFESRAALDAAREGFGGVGRILNWQEVMKEFGKQ